MDVFELSAKIALDTSGYEQSLTEAGEKTSSFGDKLKSGLATAAKVGGAAITAAAAGITALTKQSIEGYADYEQLVGGVETLFKDSALTVQGYAENAYKTAGLSANAYMETVTGFSASLLQSLGGDTQAAADKADMAITDMADNANKMGTAIDSIQNAYSGFAKQNFTMLDNLKLGYGGTKEEMVRLLEDATALTGVDYDVSSYADIVDAIHAVQTNLGITGTTAKEASETISGSVSATKSAWSNLVAGLGNENADLGQLVGNLVESAGTAAENIVPRVEQIIAGLGTAVSEHGPELATQVVGMVTGALPGVVSAAASLVTSLVSGILENLPQLAESATEIATTLASTIAENGPQLLETGVSLLEQMVDGILEGVPAMIEKLPEVIDGFLNFVTEHLPDVLEKGVEITGKLGVGIIQAIPQLVSKLPQIIVSLTKFLTENFPKILSAGLSLALELGKGIIKAIPDIIASLPELISAMLGYFKDVGGMWIDIGKDIVRGVWDGISKMAEWISGKVSDFFGGIVDGVKGLLGIQSPSKVFASIGGYMAEGLGEGWEDEFNDVKKDITSNLDFGTATVDFASSGIGKSTAGMVNGMTAGENTTSLTVNLVLPDGSNFASWVLPDLIRAADAAGTPISSGRYA